MKKMEHDDELTIEGFKESGKYDEGFTSRGKYLENSSNQKLILGHIISLRKDLFKKLNELEKRIMNLEDK